jgi:hypothetical protein
MAAGTVIWFLPVTVVVIRDEPIKENGHNQGGHMPPLKKGRIPKPVERDSVEPLHWIARYPAPPKADPE